jgi:hypothetical protein
MGIKFTRLDAESQAMVDRALAWRALHAPKRDDAGPASPASPASPTEPPRGQADSTRPAEPADPPSLRAPDQTTRPLPVAESAPPPRPIPVAEPTPSPRPIAVAEPAPPPRPIAPSEPVVRLPVEHDPSRALRIRGNVHVAADELDLLAAEWELSEERINRVLRRRRARIVDAAAELERLVRPSRSPAPPSVQEALAGLRALIERRAPAIESDIDARLSRARDEPRAQAANGEPGPANKRRIG